MTSLARFITHRARTGMRDEVRHVWETPMVPTVAENSGHLAHFYCFANDDADLIRVFHALYRPRRFTGVSPKTVVQDLPRLSVSPACRSARDMRSDAGHDFI